MTLTGKSVFITAAAQGIGRAIAEMFVSEGARVTASDINFALLSTLSGAETIQLDVTDKSSLQSLVKDVDPDILVNCAGIVNHGNILDASDDDFTFAVNLNVMSMFHSIQAVLPGMIAKERGSIVNIASVVSSVMAAPDRFIYGTTKAAVVGLTKSVARDYVRYGVRCNCICPGTVDTPSMHERLRATGDYNKALESFVKRQPMGRIANAGEIASLAKYLASEESGFTTGQAHVIDGGWANGT